MSRAYPEKHITYTNKEGKAYFRDLPGHAPPWAVDIREHNPNLTLEEVRHLDERDLVEFLQDDMCATEGCPNLSASGVIFCQTCLHDPAEKGSDAQQVAKERLEYLIRRRKKGGLRA